MRFFLVYLVLCLLLVSCNKKSSTKDPTPEQEKWVFVLAGQSNMAGRGVLSAEDTTSVEGIYMLNNAMELVPAKEPLHFYEPTLAGVGPGFAYAKAVKEGLTESHEMILVPCAVGGSSIEQWVGDSLHRNVKLYSNFQERVSKAKELGVIKAVLWHQGESNAKEDKLPLYDEQLTSLLAQIRKDVGTENLPVLLGELGDYTKPDTNVFWMKLNHILDSIASTDKNVYLVSSEGLHPKPDSIHFNTASQHKLGKRYAATFLQIQQ